jgi:hypothetical protein
MRLAVVFGVVLLTLCALLLPAQSGGGSAYESVLKELITALDMLSDVLVTVKDESSAKAAGPEVKKAVGRLDEVGKKAKALPQPEKGEKERITKTYRPKLEEAIKKLLTEEARVKAVPGGSELVKQIKAPEGKQK